MRRIDERLDNSDWANAFEYAGGGAQCWTCGGMGQAKRAPELGTEPCEECAGAGEVGPRNGQKEINPVLGYEGSIDGFGRADVDEIFALEEGENDERNWICLMRLKDGRFAFLSAGCDYTGWD